MTVQAPQVARSQTRFGPVTSTSLRSASSKVTRGSTSAFIALPLTVRVTGTLPGPKTLTSAPPARTTRGPSTSGTVKEMPDTFRKFRREMPSFSPALSSSSRIGCLPDRAARPSLVGRGRFTKFHFIATARAEAGSVSPYVAEFAKIVEVVELAFADGLHANEFELTLGGQLRRDLQVALAHAQVREDGGAGIRG